MGQLFVCQPSILGVGETDQREKYHSAAAEAPEKNSADVGPEPAGSATPAPARGPRNFYAYGQNANRALGIQLSSLDADLQARLLAGLIVRF
jgi:hypothetical protein